MTSFVRSRHTAPLAGKTICVTGASGHLGAALVRELLDVGGRVRALVHRDRRAIAGLPVEVVSGDVRDLDGLRNAFEGAAYVFHLAADVDIRKPLEALHPINVQGTANVLEAARRAGVTRVVHCSSIEALSARDALGPVTESTPPATEQTAISTYGLSKAMADRLVRDAVRDGQDVVTVHPTALLGPYDFKGSQLGTVVLLFARHRLLPTITGGFDFVDSRDVALGMLRAACTGRPGAHYILSGRWASVRELVQTVDRAMGRACLRPQVPSSLLRFAEPLTVLWNALLGRTLLDIHSLDILEGFPGIDASRTRRELDLHPRPLLATIRDTLAWARAEGRL